ncbi:heavy-metal-associated domain-containing protein [Kribbella sp. VKM Ac-2568]|uniref:heavy-metal-associated domain-containing protein n=1 Tax=Kribbella sp. VKM Ac-2568 TaxID=2512219 RepID=UPI0010D276C9|nr:heavy metal-associated domain-containing protein [Kribbella sp. VKM Ac-2568]TCM39528.1 copper chaperone CopZ [Kribbella sp. VKM Ac-2568]
MHRLQLQHRQPRDHPSTAEDTTGATYTVAGMTCGGCARSVNNSISKLDGVTSVDVDVTTGTVAVHSSTPLDDDQVRAAIEDAGYQLATA